MFVPNFVPSALLPHVFHVRMATFQLVQDVSAANQLCLTVFHVWVLTYAMFALIRTITIASKKDVLFAIQQFQIATSVISLIIV